MLVLAPHASNQDRVKPQVSVDRAAVGAQCKARRQAIAVATARRHNAAMRFESKRAADT